MSEDGPTGGGMPPGRTLADRMQSDRFGDPARLPALPPLSFLDAGHVDRVTSLVMTLAAEVWALREELARYSGSEAPTSDQREAFIRRLLDAMAPEPDPARPVRDLADRAVAARAPEVKA